MLLTGRQRDSLVELLSIGFGRAGAALSKLTGQRVLLEVPQVDVHPLDQLNATLAEMMLDEIASVHQAFSGPVAGDALLMLDARAATILSHLLTGQPALPLALDASAREALAEVGNVLLNACIGTLANLLTVQISFAVPDIDVASLSSVVDRLMARGDTSRYALVITFGFRLRESEVTGYVVIVMTVQSLSRLLIAIDAWEHSQDRAR